MYCYKNISKKDYEQFIQTRSEANFLHSWQWGEAYILVGQAVHRIGIYDGDNVVGVLQAVVENARRGRYIEVAGGPLIDWDNEAIVNIALQAMADLGRREACVCVRFRPQLEFKPEYMQYFKSLGLKKAVLHLRAEHTSIINLSQTKEGILMNMRKQTRYEIRRGEKLNVKVVRSNTPESVEEFYTIQCETARRQGFRLPKKSFYDSLAKTFADSLRIYKAEEAGQVLAMAMVIFYNNEADYFQGSSTPRGRDLPGAYVLQWNIIKDAKRAGITSYNLFGIAPEGAKNHRFSNITTFKNGFGGASIRYMPAHDIVLKKLPYLKSWSIEIIRKRTRNL